MIDFHCHLDLYPNPLTVVEYCNDLGIYVLSVTTTPSAFIGTQKLAENSKRIKTAIGLHPLLAKERKSELALFKQLLNQTRYVGEIGLDGTPEGKIIWEDQILIFKSILDYCDNAEAKILSIHSRGATKAVLEHLIGRSDKNKYVFHWFSGNLTELKVAIERGYWFSIGLPMVNSLKGSEIINRIPRDKILTETDGPFVNIGDRPMEPRDIQGIILKLSSSWNLSISKVEDQLLNNFKTLIV